MELVATPGNPIPSQPVVAEIATSDGVRLRTARWMASGKRQRGTVLLIQGRSEFIEKYFEVISDLCRRGFGVVAFDWRGQGGSSRLLPNPRKGHVDDFSDYERDLEAVMGEVMAPHMPRPWFSLAHSMGGAVLIHTLRREPDFVSRAVITAPMIEISRVMAPASAGLLAALLDGAGLGGSFIPGGGETAVTTKPFVGNPVTLDAERYGRAADVIAAAPHLGLGDPTIGWINAAWRAMAPFRDPNFPLQIRTPLLCIAGTADVVTSTPAAERFAARLKAGRSVTLTGALHEIMMERDEIRALFWAAFDAFIPGSETAPGGETKASALQEA
jgi:lysophospholipase